MLRALIWLTHTTSLSLSLCVCVCVCGVCGSEVMTYCRILRRIATLFVIGVLLNIFSRFVRKNPRVKLPTYISYPSKFLLSYSNPWDNYEDYRFRIMGYMFSC